MNYLLIGPSWVGDMVMAHSLVQRIVEGDPGAHIQMVAPPATAAIAERMEEIKQVHRLAVAHGEFGLGARWRLGRQLSSQHWDHAIVLPNSWKSALVPWFARAHKRTGWRGEARYGLLNDSKALPKTELALMIERFLALANLDEATVAKPYPRPSLRIDHRQQAQLITEFELVGDGHSVALCPGAQFGDAKQWPAQHFAEVAIACISRGFEVWLLGSPADREICAEIARRSADWVVQTGRQKLESLPSGVARVVDLCGRTSLLAAVDLLAAAAVVVANDSGLMHVACAVDTPAIALYGSTSPKFTPPLHQQAKVISLVTLDEGARRLDCQPCFERTCRFGHTNCLAELPPKAVLKELAQLGVGAVQR